MRAGVVDVRIDVAVLERVEDHGRAEAGDDLGVDAGGREALADHLDEHVLLGEGLRAERDVGDAARLRARWPSRRAPPRVGTRRAAGSR